MEWIIAYLASTIVVANIYCMVITGRSGDNDRVTIHSADDVLFANAFCLLWPIVVPVVFVRSAIKARRAAVAEKANLILRSHAFSARSECGDRSFILDVPEHELKYLLKAYRNKLVALQPPMVGIIREELMSRNMERTLLK